MWRACEPRCIRRSRRYRSTGTSWASAPGRLAATPLYRAGVDLAGVDRAGPARQAGRANELLTVALDTATSHRPVPHRRGMALELVDLMIDPQSR